MTTLTINYSFENPAPETKFFLMRKYAEHKATWKVALPTEEALGRVIFETAFGSMAGSLTSIKTGERENLKAFCAIAVLGNSRTGDLKKDFRKIKWGLGCGKADMTAIGIMALSSNLLG